MFEVPETQAIDITELISISYWEGIVYPNAFSEQLTRMPCLVEVLIKECKELLFKTFRQNFIQVEYNNGTGTLKTCNNPHNRLHTFPIKFGASMRP